VAAVHDRRHFHFAIADSARCKKAVEAERFTLLPASALLGWT
jgi:hypothetical protein